MADVGITSGPSKRPRLDGDADPAQQAVAGIAETENDEQSTKTSSLQADGSLSALDGEKEEQDPDDGNRELVPEAGGPEAAEQKAKEPKFVPSYGNYRGYYKKRRFNQDPYRGDERLALIPKEWMRDKRVLDVGCNIGKVTIEIAQTFGVYRVTGVDIDGELIRQATKEARIAWSTQEPLESVSSAAHTERERARSYGRPTRSRSPSPIDASDAKMPAAGHFPAALSRMFGYLPELPSDRLLRQYIRPTEEEGKARSQRSNGRKSRGSVMPKEVCLFPHNLRFKKADWVSQEITSDKRGYDCILALSVSKWIHLNQGDDGLIEFFTRVFTTLLPSGRFILEPQPWLSYPKAVKVSPALKESYKTIKLRPENFEKILLSEIGFQKVEKLTEDSGEGFKRPLHVYHKAAGSWL